MGDETPYHTAANLVILAPNWLGDAVMALPAIADVRRGLPGAEVTVAARPGVAPLFRLVPDVKVLPLEGRGWFDAGGLEPPRFDTAILLPNSFRSALQVSRAHVPERWGYRTDWRARLLTRAVPPPRGVHQIEYYRHLVSALGFANGSAEPRLAVAPEPRLAAEALLRRAGWDGTAPLVACAPGAAYGSAKRWPVESFAALARELADDGIRVVLIGSQADRPVTAAVQRSFTGRCARVRGRVRGPERAAPQESADGAAPQESADGTARQESADGAALLDLTGATDLVTLAGLFTLCRALVTNDSGAMHLAAAVGTPVTAAFGPTDDRATRPTGGGHAVIVGDAWCRPCMLRECPIDHRCMRSIAVETVAAATRRSL